MATELERLDKLEADVKTLYARVANKANKVDVAATQTSNLSEFNLIKADIDTIKQQIDGLVTDVTALKAATASAGYVGIAAAIETLKLLLEEFTSEDSSE